MRPKKRRGECSRTALRNREKHQTLSASTERILSDVNPEISSEADYLTIISDTPHADTNARNINAKTIHLRNWMLVVIDNGGVCVKGRCEVSDEVFWHSNEIVERIKTREIKSMAGHTYVLKDNIDIAGMKQAGFSFGFTRKFRCGFPRQWKNHVKELFKELKSNKTKEETAGNDCRKNPEAQLKDKTQMQSPTPTDKDRKYSCRGWHLRLPLHYWCGQREFWDQNMNVMLEDGGINYLSDTSVLVSQNKKLQRKTRYSLKNRKNMTETSEGQTDSEVLEVLLKDEDHVPSPVFLSGPCGKEDHSRLSDSLPMESCTQNAGWVQRRRKQKGVFTLDKHPLLCQRIDRDTSGMTTYSQATIPMVESSTGDDHSCRSKRLLHSGACEILKLEVETFTHREQVGDNSQRGRVLERLLAMEERLIEIQETLDEIRQCIWEVKDEREEYANREWFSYRGIGEDSNCRSEPRCVTKSGQRRRISAASATRSPAQKSRSKCKAEKSRTAQC